jgi:hypothetical protein
MTGLVGRRVGDAQAARVAGVAVRRAAVRRETERREKRGVGLRF